MSSLLGRYDNFTPMEHQVATVKYCIKNPYVIVALEMGLGKTLTSLILADILKSRTLVVVPSYLIATWIEQIEMFFPGKKVEVFRKLKSVAAPRNLTEIVIISYSMLPVAECLFDWASLVVFDEATYLKNTQAKRTQIAHKLIFEYAIKRCLLLTGTPILNRVYELYSLLAITYYNPEIKEDLFSKKFPEWVTFADTFSHVKEYTMEVKAKNGRVFDRKVQQWSGLKNKEELKRWLSGRFIRFKSDKVLNLPPSIHLDIMAEIDEYPDKEILAEFVKFQESAESSIASDIKAQAALMTVPFTCNYVKELLETGALENVIIYTDHIESCKEIAKFFNVTPIHGQVLAAKRSVIAQGFKKLTDKVLVATIGSFSTGENLQMCKDIVFNDLPFVPGMLSQAEFRIKRKGQTGTCRFHRILASKQVKKILNILESKNQVINQIM